MVLQKYRPGQEVILFDQSSPQNNNIYRIITVSPVFEQVSLKQKLKNLFTSGGKKKVASYLYRCKSSSDMKDFLQEELASYRRKGKTEQIT